MTSYEKHFILLFPPEDFSITNPLSQTILEMNLSLFTGLLCNGGKKWKWVNGFTFNWLNWVHLFLSFTRTMHFSPHFFEVTCCNVCQRLWHVPKVSCGYAIVDRCFWRIKSVWRAVQCRTLLLRVSPTPQESFPIWLVGDSTRNAK